jgi:hypothetical protein
MHSQRLFIGEIFSQISTCFSNFASWDSNFVVGVLPRKKLEENGHKLVNSPPEIPEKEILPVAITGSSKWLQKILLWYAVDCFAFLSDS